MTVSQKVSFTFDTLPNLLLLRFHLEIAGALADLRASVPALQDEFTGAISYHRDFVATQFPDGLVEQALQIDFNTPHCLARTRQEASSEMTRIIDLWDGFRNQTPLDIKVSNGLDTAVKPAETIYELWVLRELLKTLQTVTGSQPTFGEQGIDSPIDIGSFVLRYDMPIDQDMSRLIAGAFDVQPAYRPDYVLKHIPSDRTIWVGDAKFRKGLDHEDGYRFLRYVVDLLPAGTSTPTVATVFAPDITERTETTDRGDYQIDIVQLSPTTSDTALSSIATLVQEIR
jgi:hypothetical protein